MLGKEPKRVSFLSFFFLNKIKEPCPRWRRGAPVVECSIPNVNICRSLSLSLIWMANWYDVVVCWFPADARTRRATVNDSIASTRFHFNLSTFFSLPQSIGFLNMIYSVEKSNLIKLFFYKISGPAPIRSSNAGKQINNIILVSRQGDKLKTKQKPNSLFQRIGRWLLPFFFLGPASRKQQRPSRVFLM